MKLILLVLLLVGLAFVLSNPVDNPKRGAVDSQIKPKDTTDANGQQNHLEDRDEQFVQRQEVGHIERQVRMLIPEDLEQQDVTTGNIKSRSAEVHEHLKNGKPLKCCSDVGKALVKRYLPRLTVTTLQPKHSDSFQEYDRMDDHEDGELTESQTSGKDLGNASAVMSSRSIERLKRQNTLDALKQDDFKDEGVTEKAADIKKRQVHETDDVLTVQRDSPLEIMSERIKRLDSANITNLDELKDYLNKEITIKMDSVEVKTSDFMKKRQVDEIGTVTLIPEGIDNKDDAPEVQVPILPEAVEEHILGTIPEVINNHVELDRKREVKSIENADTAKKSKDCHHHAGVKAVPNEEAVEAAVRVEPVGTDIDAKLADEQQSDRDVKATRKRRSAAIIETIDDVIPQSLPLLTQDVMTVMYEVNKREVDPETNTATASNGDLHHLNRVIEITEADMGILVEGASITQNGEQQQDIRPRSKRQSDDDSSANYYTNLNKPKPFAVFAAEDRATGYFTQPFQQSDALKPPHSGSKPVSHLKHAAPLDSPLSAIISHPQFCDGVHQIIIHDPVHCPILTCRDFDSLKYEWLLCVYGPMSRVVVLGDGDIPVGDNIFGNYPSLQCVCDMGFVMNKVGECVRRSNC